MSENVLATLDRWRHRVPFWWWLTYDGIVGVVIFAGVPLGSAAFVVGLAVLGIAVVIDFVEFLVKRPAARAQLDADSTLNPS